MFVGGQAVPEDKLVAEIKISRYDMGGRVMLTPSVTSKPVPFTLGPWSGTAFITQGNELGFSDGLMTLSFDLELIPKEQFTIAQVLVELFGAEIVK